MGPDAEHRPAEIPYGSAASELPACDLIMKGGVTSGLVYPRAVLQLAREYRFASIGGSSAGAIAAAFTAAAECSRQSGDAEAMRRLDEAVDDLAREGRLIGLFQATPKSRPLFDVLVRAFRAEMSVTRRVVITLVASTLGRPLVALLGVALLAALGILAYAASDALGVVLAVLLAVVLALAVVVATAVAAILVLLQGTMRALEGSRFGMCPGTKQEGRSETALIDWLHERIQACAGKADDDPLTFRDLERHGIELTMMSSDLSLARPVRVPDDLGDYWFDPAELGSCFPDCVASAMLEASTETRGGRRRMPVANLPVLVAVRLSLSFPILLSAMPLQRPDPDDETQFVAHLLSDGGIGSNFPIHFFDAWFPGRPTFGIDLTLQRTDAPPEPYMLTDPKQPVRLRWTDIGGLPSFLWSVADTAQNWRDTLQSELPGFRDRVCHIELSRDEGGLNLYMDQAVIERLIDRGDQAGELIRHRFDDAQWLQHRWVRYLTLMAQLHDNLHHAGPPFRAFAPDLRQGLAGVEVYRDGRDTAWCEGAADATEKLVELAGRWGPPPLAVDFDGGGGPEPRPELRIVPRA